MDANMLSPILWRDGALFLLDQRVLPHREEQVRCADASAAAAAIRTMVVRGAPAIGIAAAYGLALEAGAGRADDASLERAAAELTSARPTAVNLRWAVERMLRVARNVTLADRPDRLLEEAHAIHEEDIAANRAIGAFGASLLGSDVSILTHCNAGALATGGWGTALGVVRSAVLEGKRVVVWADETRPWLQGSRLTAWELSREGIDVTLIADDMAGALFRLETFDAVIVGADRIAANGDVANKIGTYTLAVLANAHGIPFYVAAPTSTIDLRCESGSEIPIEERDPAEVLSVTGVDEGGQMRTVRVAANVPARHLAFDVTPWPLITAIITERGVCRSPYGDSLARACAVGG